MITKQFFLKAMVCPLTMNVKNAEELNRRKKNGR
jgi:hypothetical protein